MNVPSTSVSSSSYMPVSCSTPTTAFTTVMKSSPVTTVMPTTSPIVTTQVTPTPTSTCIYKTVTKSTSYTQGPQTTQGMSAQTKVITNFWS